MRVEKAIGTIEDRLLRKSDGVYDECKSSRKINLTGVHLVTRRQIQISVPCDDKNLCHKCLTFVNKNDKVKIQKCERESENKEVHEAQLWTFDVLKQLIMPFKHSKSKEKKCLSFRCW